MYECRRVARRFVVHAIEERCTVARQKWDEVEHSLLTLTVGIQGAGRRGHIPHHLQLPTLHRSEVSPLDPVDPVKKRSPQSLQRRRGHELVTIRHLEGRDIRLDLASQPAQ
jgi:hypothetical protein